MLFFCLNVAKIELAIKNTDAFGRKTCELINGGFGLFVGIRLVFAVS